MCGISGFLSIDGFSYDAANDICLDMGNRLIHRGPDAYGSYIDADEGVALVHRRLSILDLSSSGHQPMHSFSGRYIIVLNGEIYNHRSLRLFLHKSGFHYPWASNSDTETILACFDFFGIEKTLSKLVGMFAIAVLDRHLKSIFLIRDRIGEKPLYYGRVKNNFFFTSELKALIAHPGFKPTIDPKAVAFFATHNYIPAPYSIFKEIKKLRPGTFVRLGEEKEPQSYWDLKSGKRDFMVSEGQSPSYYLNTLEELLSDAVSLQMHADVPVGAFLSGGVDSSLIVSLMQERCSTNVNTFSIGFEEQQLNEAPFAKRIAQHLGTNHTELYIGKNDVIDLVPELSFVYDEPFADSSQIPTLLVSKLASKQVTVAITGDGGDEFFGGYNRYVYADKIRRIISTLPLSSRKFIAKNISAIPEHFWNKLYSAIQSCIPSKFGELNPGAKAHKLASILCAGSPSEIYFRLISHCDEQSSYTLGKFEDLSSSEFQFYEEKIPFIERMMQFDARTYLPDDILVKVDRASMAASLETRAPFLDHRVIRFAQNMPLDQKVKDGVGKLCLKRLLRSRVPESLFDRPKVGFGVPLADWLRGPLNDWAEEILNEKKLRETGYFDANKVMSMWKEHKSGAANFQYKLWNVLTFESWRRNSGF